MTQSDLNRCVAHATGESVREIARRGFVTLSSIPVERDPEDLIRDWDERHARHSASVTAGHRDEPAVA